MSAYFENLFPDEDVLDDEDLEDNDNVLKPHRRLDLDEDEEDEEGWDSWGDNLDW